MSLICAILGWTVFPVLGLLLGVGFGHAALRQIKLSKGTLKGRGFAVTALWVSYVPLVFGLCALITVFTFGFAEDAHNMAEFLSAFTTFLSTVAAIVSAIFNFFTKH